MPKQQTDASRKTTGDLRFYLSLTVLLVAGAFLCSALVRVPRLSIDAKTLVLFAVGAIPVPILKTDYRFRYLALTLVLSGIAGLALFIRQNFGCLTDNLLGGNYQCAAYFNAGQESFAGIFYLSLLVIGLLLGRFVSKRK
jgi:hypothetical protein